MRKRCLARSRHAAATTDECSDRRRVMRVAKRRPHDERALGRQHAGDRVHGGHLERRIVVELRQQAGQPCREHRLAGARVAEQERVMRPGRRDLDRPAPGGLPKHVGQIGTVHELVVARRDHLRQIDHLAFGGRSAGPQGLQQLAK
jgi:hypothetical protein